jgi:hypothetical protein
MGNPHPDDDPHRIPRRHLLRKAGLVGAAAAGLSALFPSEALAEYLKELEENLRKIAASAAGYNVAIGNEAGHAGEKNVAIGANAGTHATGSGNVLIGYQAGEEAGSSSDRLYIANSNTNTPLIGGNFTADEVTIHGSLTVTSAITTGEPPSSVVTSSTANEGKPQKRLSQIKGGVPAWIDDSGGMPLKAFGAKWDGTDDSKALEEAIAASIEVGGVPILLPAGKGVIASEPQIPTQNPLTSPPVQVPIWGAGRLATTVELLEAMSFTVFAHTSPGNTVGFVDMRDFTIDGHKQQISGEYATPVVIGTNVNSNERVNISQIRLRRIRVINVPTLESSAPGRRCVNLSVQQGEPGHTENSIENIDIRQCEFLGGQYGVFIGASAGAGLPANVYLSHIYLGDLMHVVPGVPKAFGASCNFQVGQGAWSDGRSIVLERLYGENSDDVGIEMDVPCIINDCYVKNANDTAYLFNTFNVATTAQPVVAKTTAEAPSGSTVIAVPSSSLTPGQQVVLGPGSEVRTIKAKPDSAHIELATPTGTTHASGTWIQQVDDMAAVNWQARNITAVRTENLPGNQHGLTVQNSENVRPAPEVRVNGYTYSRRGVTGRPTVQGEVVACSTGTINSPTGNPRALRIKDLKADVQGLENSSSENQSYWPVYLSMRGPASCAIEIQGDVTVEGPGATGTGKLSGQIIHFSNSCGIVDIDLTTQWVFGANTGEVWRSVAVNAESSIGDLSGRIRHRTRPSGGTGTMSGVYLGKPIGFGSTTSATKLAEAAVEGATTIVVESATGIVAGQPLVIDALSTTLYEIGVVKSVSGSKVTLLSGLAKGHSSGATVARLNIVEVIDSNWTGFGSISTSIGVAYQDSTLAPFTLTRGNVLPSGLPEAQPSVTFANQTAAPAHPVAGGLFYVKEGKVYWLDEAGTSTLVAA